MDQRRTALSQSTPTLPNVLDRHNGQSSQIGQPGSARNTALHAVRHHSHGAVASHFLSQSPGAFGGQTWMDFLRESGAGDGPSRRPNNPHSLSEGPPRHPLQYTHHTMPAPADPRNSDRKRRLTTAESPMRRPSSILMHSGTAGNSSSDPLVLDSPPLQSRPPPPPSLPSQNTVSSARRESDIVLPPWQPDSDVTHCPVCGSQFTFFYRKHHCRKCGRVVCSACSPHRITIPRQFIVQPLGDSSGLSIIDLTSDDEANPMSAFAPFRNPALGGGEEVRVCNPCVPDPNYSPPPQYTPAPSRHSMHFPSSGRPSHAAPPQPRPLGHRSSHSVHDGTQTIGHGQSSYSRDPFSDRRVSFRNSTRVADLWPPTQAPQSRPQHDTRAEVFGRPVANSSSHMHPPTERDPSMFHRAFFPNTPPQSQPQQHPQPQPPPRRQIAEEDECPVCGNELPPKGPEDDESARTQHVEDCIAMHSSSPPPAPTNQTSTSLPSQRTRGMSTAGNGEGASSNRMSISARGMIVYTATEKDCFDEDGNETECVICFDEFEQGDRMGRLVCWCKFHENCIRQWWEKKGRGACPTHQLHD